MRNFLNNKLKRSIIFLNPISKDSGYLSNISKIFSLIEKFIELN